MKKLIVLLICLLTFVSCAGSDFFKDEPEITAITGILSEQTNNDSESGTHFLTIPSGEKISLRSLSINLSSVRYIGNEVEVTGFMNVDDNVFEVSGISVVELLSDKREILGEFKEYKQSRLGYQLKYYNDWSVFERENSVRLSAPSTEGSTVSPATIDIFQQTFSYSPDEDTPLSAYYAQNLVSDSEFGNLENIDSLINKIGVDKLDSLKFEYENGDIKYFIYRPGFIYEIFYSSINDSSDTYKNIFNEMIAEFRFIPFGLEESDSDVVVSETVVPADDIPLGALPALDIKLTTFESLPYSFGANYPASWYYAGSTSTETGVLRHYGFRDEPAEDNNELISLDVISGPIPSTAQKQPFSDIDLYLEKSDGNVALYTVLDGKTFKVSGDSDYEDIIFNMAASIYTIENPEE